MSATIGAEFRSDSPRWSPAVLELDVQAGRVLVEVTDKWTLGELLLNPDDARELAEQLQAQASYAALDDGDDDV